MYCHRQSKQFSIFIVEWRPWCCSTWPGGITVGAIGVGADKADGLRRKADAASTRLAYASDLRAFEKWCSEVGHTALPATPAIVAAYLRASPRSYAMATLRRRIAAIACASAAVGAPLDTKHPEIREAARATGARYGEPARRAAVLTTEDLRRLVTGCGDDLAGLRDRALLAVGFASALRRAELVAIDAEHLIETPAGLKLSVVPRSDAELSEQTREIFLERAKITQICPVRAMRAWLAGSGIQQGPVFRKVGRGGVVSRRGLSTDAVRQILRRRAADAGIKGLPLEAISPNSLRSGFVASAYRRGVQEEQIMAHAGHKSPTTLRKYRRRAQLPSDKLGLAALR